MLLLLHKTTSHECAISRGGIESTHRVIKPDGTQARILDRDEKERSG